MNRVTQPYFRGRCPPVILKNHSKQKISSLKYRKCRDEKSIDLLFTGSEASVQLLREIGRGGEGAVYDTDHKNLVAKIYHNAMNNRQVEKICKMIEQQIEETSFHQPVKMLYDHQCAFQGFLMTQVTGISGSVVVIWTRDRDSSSRWMDFTDSFYPILYQTLE